MEDETSVRRLHKFSARRGEDFTLWTLRFEALLESKDLLDCVSTDPLDNFSFSELEADARSRVLKTKSLLVQSLGDKPLRTVAGERKIHIRCIRNFRNVTQHKTPLEECSFRQNYTRNVLKCQRLCPNMWMSSSQYLINSKLWIILCQSPCRLPS